MSVPKHISSLRRTVSRTLYSFCGLSAIVGFYFLLTDFGGNIWVFSLFGALGLFIIGNTVAYSDSKRLVPINPNTPLIELSPEEVRRRAEFEHLPPAAPQHTTDNEKKDEH